MDTLKCKVCCKSFNHLLKHLAKSSICKEKYLPDELDNLKMACSEIVKNKRNSKRRQNYDSEIESERKKRRKKNKKD